MTLIDVVRRLQEFDDELTIYAKRPWSPDSVAIVEREPEEGGLPAGAAQFGADYFLEVFIAREFLDGWVSDRPSATRPEDACAILIQYAEFDA